MTKPSGYLCPQCGARMAVKDSRHTASGHVRRCRACPKCITIFYTIESPEGETDRHRTKLAAKLLAQLQAIGDLIAEIDAEHGP